MKNLLIFITLIGLIVSCSSEKSPNKQGSEFHTTPPSLLYFKNIRSTSYTQTEQANTRVELFQLKKLDLNTNRPIIYPVIANNWLAEEAYLLIKTNDYVNGFKEITIEWEESNESQSLSMGTPNFKNQYQFGLTIYELLNKGVDIRTRDELGNLVNLFDNYGDKSAFQTTMNDYLKLIEMK